MGFGAAECIGNTTAGPQQEPTEAVPSIRSAGGLTAAIKPAGMGDIASKLTGLGAATSWVRQDHSAPTRRSTSNGTKPPTRRCSNRACGAELRMKTYPMAPAHTGGPGAAQCLRAMRSD
jgi:hypothetical protein